jgi:hypothetical protein
MAKLPVTTPRIEPTPGPLDRVISVYEPNGHRNFGFFGQGIRHERIPQKRTGSIGICPIASRTLITR